VKANWRKGALGVLLTTSLSVATPLVASAATTYEYQGNPYTFFSCGPNSTNTGTISCSIPAPTNPDTSYVATDRVTVTLSLDSPLPANLAFQDIRSFPGFQLTMHDGQQTLTSTTAVAMFSYVGTDSSGRISQWRLALYTGGVINGSIVTFNFSDGAGPHIFDWGTLACCDPTVPGNLAQNFGAPGTWGVGGQTPEALTTTLIGLITNPALALSNGQIASLTDKLNSALASMQAGQTRQAINQLQAFINAVESAQKTRKISTPTAETLIDAAEQIIALL
jgi:hypothetical protein